MKQRKGNGTSSGKSAVGSVRRSEWKPQGCPQSVRKQSYVSEKGAQDVHTKQQLRAEEVKKRIKKIEAIKNDAEDGETIREWARKHERPKENIQFEEGYKKRKHRQEIECAEWMSAMFGGKVKCLNEAEVHQMPDFLWNGKAWEEKTASSVTSIDRNVRKACHQISSMEGVDPGGIIITLNCEKSTIEDCIKAAEHRLKREKFLKNVSLIIKKGNKILKIIEK